MAAAPQPPHPAQSPHPRDSRDAPPPPPPHYRATPRVGSVTGRGPEADTGQRVAIDQVPTGVLNPLGRVWQGAAEKATGALGWVNDRFGRWQAPVARAGTPHRQADRPPPWGQVIHLDRVQAGARILHAAQVDDSPELEQYTHLIRSANYGDHLRALEMRAAYVRQQAMYTHFDHKYRPLGYVLRPDTRHRLVLGEYEDFSRAWISQQSFIVSAARLAGLDIPLNERSQEPAPMSETLANGITDEDRALRQERQIGVRHDRDGKRWPVQAVFACLYVPPGFAGQAARAQLWWRDGGDSERDWAIIAHQAACLIGWYLYDHRLRLSGAIGTTITLGDPRGDRSLTPLLHAFARELTYLGEDLCGDGQGQLGCVCALVQDTLDARVEECEATGALDQQRLRLSYQPARMASPARRPLPSAPPSMPLAAQRRPQPLAGYDTTGSAWSAAYGQNSRPIPNPSRPITSTGAPQPYPTSGRPTTPPSLPLRPRTVGDPLLHPSNPPSQPSDPRGLTPPEGWSAHDLIDREWGDGREGA